MLRYEGGEEHVVCGLDPDMWSYFEALGILKKDFKYDGELYMWWKPKKGRMDRDLRPLCEDRHALELAEYAENINEEVEIYVDHLVSSAQVIELVEGVNGDGVNEEHSNAVVNGVGVNEEEGIVVVNGGGVNDEEVNVAANVGGVNDEEANVAAIVGGVNDEEANVVVNGGMVTKEEAKGDADGWMLVVGWMSP